MNDWDLRRLRVLRAVRDQASVRAAAEVLRMTPSAVSQQLSALARATGVTLVESHGRSVRLTDAAHVVLRHADAVFAQLEQAEAELLSYGAGRAGTVNVAAFATAVPRLVVPAVQELRRYQPELRVRVRESEAGAVYGLLGRGEVDLGLSLAAHAPRARDGEFERLVLLADPLHVALPSDHRLARLPGLRLADLAEEPWIVGDSGPWREITEAACAQAGFTPDQAHAATDWPAIFALVGAGLGVALVPQLAAGHGPGVTVRRLEADRPHRHVVAVVRAGAWARPQLVRVLRALENAAAHSWSAGTSGTAPTAEVAEMADVAGMVGTPVEHTRDTSTGDS
ncbi:LysR family transcriptional regulator [Lipingzhangella sp. LS1_29]|uniref:LysR family transcriptional regulator n=1 Tax=Lipingzhangella rawalii TaxID=2055835 RepID=A0ABU2H1K4_9ACTN|nr:LysR family transcriptional regulator [Lipingzhangella rawalii]MDS1269178.1 LysR family transcriptional regulator [Lipingzhangella rawalii]